MIFLEVLKIAINGGFGYFLVVWLFWLLFGIFFIVVLVRDLKMTLWPNVHQKIL